MTPARRRESLRAIVLAVALVATGCSETIYEVIPVGTVAIDGIATTLVPGQSVQLSARILGSGGESLSGRTVSWSSNNTAVATVSATGLMSTVGPGNAQITASADGVSQASSITVNYPTPTVSSISPSSAVTGTATTVTVTGSRFYPTSVVRLNGVAKTTTYVSSTQLRVSLAAADVATPGSAAVTVFNPTPGGGSSNSVTLTVSSQQLITIVVTNSLLNTVNVLANNAAIGSVPAGETRQATINYTSSLTIGWDLVRSTTTAGTPIGDVIGGNFAPITNPGTQVSVTVDAELGSDFIFTPTISNQTSTTLLMSVNHGLTAENRCNCTVPAFSTGTRIGYYRRFSNSNVRAYRNGSGYTGTYVFWENFSANVNQVSGALALTTSIAPVVPAEPGPGIPGAMMKPEKPDPTLPLLGTRLDGPSGPRTVADAPR